MTIGVLEPGSAADAKPETFLPKHQAKRLVKRGWAEFLSKAVIRRFPNKHVFELETSKAYPIQKPHPELENAPSHRYPMILAPRNLETLYT